jgi:hypothetical protein
VLGQTFFSEFSFPIMLRCVHLFAQYPDFRTIHYCRSSQQHSSQKFSSQHSTIKLYILTQAEKHKNLSWLCPRHEGKWGGGGRGAAPLILNFGIR